MGVLEQNLHALEGYCSRWILRVTLDLDRRGCSDRSGAIRLRNAIRVNIRGEEEWQENR